MSLGSMLHSVIRPKIPDAMLMPCLPGDRQLVENIIMISQELIPTLDVTRAALTKQGTAYSVVVPSATATDKVGLNELRDVQGFCPGRIQNIHILYRNDTINVQIDIQDETMPITSTQLDIVRVSKKRNRGIVF